MAEQFKEHIVSDTPILKPSDVVDSIIFALSAPQHVTVSVNVAEWLQFYHLIIVD